MTETQSVQLPESLPKEQGLRTGFTRRNTSMAEDGSLTRSLLLLGHGDGEVLALIVLNRLPLVGRGGEGNDLAVVDGGGQAQ